jgi:hypothetical protein
MTPLPIHSRRLRAIPLVRYVEPLPHAAEREPEVALGVDGAEVCLDLRIGGLCISPVAAERMAETLVQLAAMARKNEARATAAARAREEVTPMAD